MLVVTAIMVLSLCYILKVLTLCTTNAGGTRTMGIRGRSGGRSIVLFWAHFDTVKAGYHVELAGGGHYSPAALRAKVTEIQGKISLGIGLTLNSLYINPRQFSFQLPLWQDMRREGFPIEGFCVAAGIPTTKKAAEIISGLKSVGIRHVAFKPGDTLYLHMCAEQWATVACC
jgi:hypothetical protein